LKSRKDSGLAEGYCSHSAAWEWDGAIQRRKLQLSGECTFDGVNEGGEDGPTDQRLRETSTFKTPGKSAQKKPWTRKSAMRTGPVRPGGN